MTGRDVVRGLTIIGFEVVRVSGSHHVMKREGHRLLVTVPIHGGRPLATGTLRRIIRDAGLSVEKFRDALDS